MRGHRDLVLACVAALVCALAAVLLPLTALRVVFAIPLCLLAPGYAITAATFARRPLGRPQVALLSVALSLTVLALGALLLNYLGGLRSGTWALLLVAVTIGRCRAAALRRPERGRRPEPTLPRIPPLQAVLYVAGIAAAAAAVSLAFIVLPAKNAIGHTETWISSVDEGATTLIEIGVRSQEQHAADYFLRVRVGRTERPTIRLFNLVPGEERTIPLHVPTPALPQPTTASLFRQIEPERVYRRIYTTIGGEEG